MRELGIGIGKILKPLGGLTEDVAWVHPKYPQVLKRLAKHPHFAEHGKNATLMADAYICGFMRGVFAETFRELVQLEVRAAKRTKRTKRK